MNTYQETRPLHLLSNGKELIQWSERDGWAHLYLYDDKGNLKNRITKGPWHVEEILKVDNKARVIYFTANGMNPNENPYYEHLYRVNLDGSGLKQLSKGDYFTAWKWMMRLVLWWITFHVSIQCLVPTCWIRTVIK